MLWLHLNPLLYWYRSLAFYNRQLCGMEEGPGGRRLTGCSEAKQSFVSPLGTDLPLRANGESVDIGVVDLHLRNRDRFLSVFGGGESGSWVNPTGVRSREERRSRRARCRVQCASCHDGHRHLDHGVRVRRPFFAPGALRMIG